MKAAVINQFGETPQCVEFPDPVPYDRGKLVFVKASVLENFDKITAGGTHYSSKKMFPRFPAIIGTDGVGMTEEGKLVSFGSIRSPYGAFAEKVIAGYTMPVPDDIDPAMAAAIPRSALTSLLPLKYTAKLQPGETVLVNGATGVSGRIATQIAKMLGAGRVIGTGRNENSLALLRQSGMDSVINLKQSDDLLASAFSKENEEGQIDVVIDFLWGRPAEILINTFIPKEAGFPKRNIRYIQMGDKAGPHISLSGPALRTSGLQLMGIGQIAQEALAEEIGHVWHWIREGALQMEIERVPLTNIAAAWQREDLAGKRLVVIP